MNEYAQKGKWKFLEKFAQKPQLKEYEWMLKPTPQEEWIEGPGIYLWLAFFFSEIGAGIYFVSLFMNFRFGLIVGWLMTLVLGGLIHMKYLGKPNRVLRIFMRPQTSELARGMWVILIFAVLGFLQIVPGFFPFLPWTGYNILFKILMAIVSLLLIMHGFATMNVVKALPSWNSTVILPLSIVSGIWVGSQFVQSFLGFTAVDLAGFEVWSRVLLLTYMVFLVLYLWGTFHESETAQFSIQELLKGSYSRLFYAVVIAGIVLPLLLTLVMLGNNVSGFLVFLRLLFVFFADMLLRYSIMKSAYYSPLL
jgi:hypothetical protein